MIFQNVKDKSCTYKIILTQLITANTKKYVMSILFQMKTTMEKIINLDVWWHVKSVAFLASRFLISKTKINSEFYHMLPKRQNWLFKSQITMKK